MRWITNFFFFCLAITCLSFFSDATLAINTKGNTLSPISSDQIKQAAQNGDADAQYALGYMFYYGKGGLQRDVAEAKRWIGMAADNKQPQAIRAQKLMLAAEEKSKMNQFQVANTAPSANVTRTASNDPIASVRNNYVAHNESISNHIVNLDSKKSVQRAKEIEREAASENLVTVHREPHQMNASSSEKRLLEVPSHFYTVQLLAGENKDAVDRMMLKPDLKENGAVYHTYRNAKLMYVLIYGQYKTKQQADVVATQLHKKLKLDPWVKTYASVKKSIAEE